MWGYVMSFVMIKCFNNIGWRDHSSQQQWAAQKELILTTPVLISPRPRLGVASQPHTNYSQHCNLNIFIIETFCLISPAHLRPCWPLCCWSVVSCSSASETFYFLFWSINLQHLVMVCRPILLRSIHLFNDKKCSGLLKTFRWGHFFYRYALVTNGLFHPQPRPAGLAAHQAAAHHRHRGIFGVLQWVDIQYCCYKIWNMLIFTPASQCRAGVRKLRWVWLFILFILNSVHCVVPSLAQCCKLPPFPILTIISDLLFWRISGKFSNFKWFSYS